MLSLPPSLRTTQSGASNLEQKPYTAYTLKMRDDARRLSWHAGILLHCFIASLLQASNEQQARVAENRLLVL